MAAFIGAAGEGKSPPQCALTTSRRRARHREEGHAGNVYELAGDDARTLRQLADELTIRAEKSSTRT